MLHDVGRGSWAFYASINLPRIGVGPDATNLPQVTPPA